MMRVAFQGERGAYSEAAAIAYFEDAVKESDEIIADCTEALRAELIEQKQNFAVALEVMRRTQPENKHGILLHTYSAIASEAHSKSMDWKGSVQHEFYIIINC